MGMYRQKPVAIVRLQNGRPLAVRIGKLVIKLGRRIGYVNTRGGVMVPYKGKRYVATPIFNHQTAKWAYRWHWVNESRLPV